MESLARREIDLQPVSTLSRGPTGFHVEPGPVSNIPCSLAVPYHNIVARVCMSSSGASPSLADRLAMACYKGDLPSAKAAVADGASVNEKGRALGWGVDLPLVPAVDQRHHDVVVWLLSHGADPNGEGVMWYGAWYSTAAILQLLIDAGGDVNRASGIYGGPPLFTAVEYNSKDN